MALPQKDIPELNNEELRNHLNKLESEVNLIKQRNTGVERDKAWEVSKSRVFFLIAFTYLITSLVFWFISVPSPLLNALIPTIGYLLSTQSLPLLKRWWLCRYK
jgi:hypothetical protein